MLTARRTMSRWPFVTGSKRPGYIATVIPHPLPLDALHGTAPRRHHLDGDLAIAAVPRAYRVTAYAPHVLPPQWRWGRAQTRLRPQLPPTRRRHHTADRPLRGCTVP